MPKQPDDNANGGPPARQAPASEMPASQENPAGGDPAARQAPGGTPGDGDGLGDPSKLVDWLVGLSEDGCFKAMRDEFSKRNPIHHNKFR